MKQLPEIDALGPCPVCGEMAGVEVDVWKMTIRNGYGAQVKHDCNGITVAVIRHHKDRDTAIARATKVWNRLSKEDDE